MNNTLRVSFTFPGYPTVIEIHVNREIGVGNGSSRYDYECIPEVEIALSSVPALVLTSVYTRVEKNSYTTEFGIGFDRDSLCLDIAIALGEAFDANDIVIGEVIDNRTGRMVYC